MRRGKRAVVAVHTKVALQRSIRQSKCWMWNDYLLSHRGGEVWRAATFNNP
jgi:hypothetical protein